VSKIIEFCKQKWFIQLLGIIALGLLIWFFGGLIAFAGRVPLESEVSRLLTILAIVLVWGLNNLRIQIQANRNTNGMVAALADDGKKQDTEEVSTAANAEAQMLSKNFSEALQLLKKTQSKNRYGSQYLYDLPWYIFIGPPGSGKTTALINSGLEFPLADKLGKGAIRGIGGTRDCDWWFTDHAVLLDTAGRYTTQDSHEAIDKAGWSGFLDLLKKYRPRRPLNGILITMSLVDLLKQTEEERLLHAQTIRKRLDELYERFGIRIPIYMIFTKGDLVAGFNDFFADLGKEERAQVWGVTFKQENQQKTDDVIEGFASHFDDLLTRLQSRLCRRLLEERDLKRRALIFGFPQRMALLKDNLLSFLHECYGENRYQTLPYLRGVYFTSGTQEGTPIDRLMGILAQTFRVDRINVPLFSGKGKSYFITRLLKEVIFAEALLVDLNPRIERIQTLLRRATYSLAATITVAMTVIWFASYSENQEAITALSEKIQQYETTAIAKPQYNFSDLLARMNVTQAISTVYADEVPWRMRFGLYQGEALASVSKDTYQQMLQTQFLPLITQSLEQRLKSAEGQNPEVLYGLLKVYLMLGEPKRLEAGLVRTWLEIDWKNNYSSEASGLLKHLDNLLKLPPEVQQLDKDLIASSRKILNRTPIAQQIYLRLKNEALQEQDNYFYLSQALAPNGNQVFTTVTGSLEQQTIPYLFTYDGFYQVFLKQSKELINEFVNQNWVLGEAAKLEIADIPALEQVIQDYYYVDYIKYWEGLLANVKLKPINTLQDSLELLQYASAPDSPLKQLLMTLSKQTSLTVAPKNLSVSSPKNILTTADKVKSVGENLTSLDSRAIKLLNTAKAVDSNKKAEPLGNKVEQHFKPLTALVKTTGGIAPFDQTITALAQLYANMIDIARTSNVGGAALNAAQQRNGNNDTLAKIKMESSRLPEPFKSMMSTISTSNLRIIMGNSKTQLNKLWQTEVMPLYNAGIIDRYPFVKKTLKEVSLQDFSRFFAKNGVLDKFFTSHLKAFVDTSGEKWQLLTENNQTIGISETVLAQFQTATKIQQIFFQDAAKTPLIKFNLRPIELDGNAAKFWLNIEGQKTEYSRATPDSKSKPFQWPGAESGMVSFGFETLNGKKLKSTEEGVWAWFRVLDRLTIQESVQDSYLITFDIEGLKAIYELSANSVDNPFSFSAFKNIRFPKSLY
jgi:type VI secretion system protein ImpL